MRRNRRKNNQPNANRPWTDAEIREAADDHIRGSTIGQIARDVKREHAAVRSIFDKMEADYTEKGARRSIIERMSGVRSGLDYKRQVHSRMERGFFSRALDKLWSKHKDKGKVILLLSIIFHLTGERILHLERVTNGGFGLGTHLQDED